MKHKLPCWLLCFLCSICLFFGVMGYLLVHRTAYKEELVTLSGNNSVLSGITLQYDTLLSSSNDIMSCAITLGSSSFRSSTFQEQLSLDPIRSLDATDCPTIDFEPSYSPVKKQIISDCSQVFSEIPFTYYYTRSNTGVKFPYIQLKTPSDMQLYYDKEMGSYESNYSFSADITDYVTLNGKQYFSILSITDSWEKDDSSTKGLEYTIHGGIFEASSRSASCVYDYTITNDPNSPKILSLFAIENQNCLGLLVQEENSYHLKLVDPVTKNLKADLPLGDVPAVYEGGESLAPYIDIHYNSSSQTLTVLQTLYQPLVSVSKINSLYEAYSAATTQAECYSYKEQLKNCVRSYSTLTCYTLTEEGTLIKEATYDADVLSSLLTDTSISLMEACDYLYKENTLYVICLSFHYDTGYTPYLLAVQENKVLYEGYVDTSANDDYKNNRYAVISYLQDHAEEEGDPYFYSSPSFRQIGRFQLSLTN